MGKLVGYLKLNLKQKIFNIKFVVSILVVIMIFWENGKPYRELSMAVNYPMTFAILPIYMENFLIAIIWIMFIYVNSDIPFMQYSSIYQIIRLSRKKWILLQSITLFIRSLVFSLVLLIVSIISLFPKIEFNLFSWGKLMKTMASTNLTQIKGIAIPSYINIEFLKIFTPLQAILIQLLYITLCGTFVSLFIFTISLYINRVLPIIIMLWLIFLQILFTYTYAKIIAIFGNILPFTIIRLSKYGENNFGYNLVPSVTTVISYFIVGIVILLVLALGFSKKIKYSFVNEEV